MATKKKAEYTQPRSKVDLEERLANDNKSDLVLSTYSDEKPEPDQNARVFTLEDNKVDAYIGTDPVYQNYASDALKPMRAEDGPEAELEARAYGEADEATTVPDEDDEDDESDDKSKDDDKGTSTAQPPASPVTPAGNK